MVSLQVSMAYAIVSLFEYGLQMRFAPLSACPMTSLNGDCMTRPGRFPAASAVIPLPQNRSILIRPVLIR
jgi:hypothetical protein